MIEAIGEKEILMYLGSEDNNKNNGNQLFKFEIDIEYIGKFNQY